jgi:hypothetical protein
MYKCVNDVTLSLNCVTHNNLKVVSFTRIFNHRI